MVAAMDAEDEVTIDGLRMGRQVLRPGGQCLPAGGAGSLATAGVVDPIEDGKDRDNHKQHQVIHRGVPPCGERGTCRAVMRPCAPKDPAVVSSWPLARLRNRGAV
ncbi:hypothetical protein D3C75_1197750 [compost metagenome]